ncbi:hypothetical protein CXF85_06170 [Colwellia sp. 75C3]|uniref:methyltransferase family protein n=1 Tax=Colwellia sp. 75C3 TaxID=888425 RepID=UPI000C336EDE|nr:isoprenylcysteine carboxylmethyltransferase family protein [Colwellia sp. 75C3]PKG85183.1 hypothetical protein CXF85_06170 [Colwellia sp. 75C3]
MTIKGFGIKLIKGTILSFLFVLAFSFFQPDLLESAKVKLMIVISILASLFQPDYSPFKSAKDEHDKGTALHIIWAVYLSQIFVLAEFVFNDYQGSMQWSVISIIGAALAIFGLLFRSWAFLELGHYFTWHISVTENQKVVDTGPYRYVCHPGYSGALLTYVATGLMFHSWVAAFISLLILFYAFYRRIKFEEAFLAIHLGSEYLEYLKKRHKIIPFLY